MSLFTTWGSALIASGFSFLSNLLMARILSAQDYVTYVSFLGAVGFFNILQPSIQTITARQVALDTATKTQKESQDKFIFIWLVGIILSIIGGLVLQVLVPWIAQIMLSDLSLVQFLPLCFSFGLIVAISMGGLQGRQQVFAISVATLLSASLRLPISLILVVLGFSIQGAVITVPIVAALMAVTTSLLNFFPLSKIKSLTTSRFFDLNNQIRSELFFRAISASFLPVFTYLGFLVLTSIDVILVKRFLASDMQSYYVLIATLGKIALYATQPIAILLLPRATALSGQGKSTHKLLWQYVAITIGLGFITCVILFVGGSWVTHLFMPSFPDHLIPYIALYACAMSLIGLIYILNNFCVAVNIKSLAILQVIAILILVGLFLTQNLSLPQVIAIMIAIALALCIGGIMIVASYKDPRFKFAK